MSSHGRKVVCQRCGHRTHRQWRDDDPIGYGVCSQNGCGGELKPANFAEEKRTDKAKAELRELEGGGRL